MNQKTVNEITSDVKPSDTIILKNGNYKDKNWTFELSGTESNRIHLKGESYGGVIFTGASALTLRGAYITLSHVIFQEGSTPEKDVIRFDKGSHHLRLTESAIIDYNPTKESKENKWVSLYGQHHQVDHNYFSGKNNIGALLVIWREDTAENFHQVERNYFSRPTLVDHNNGGECIRIGTSQYSASDSSSLVESNLFQACDGEIEIISVKSGNNRIINNTFRNSAGMLTLRHGSGSHVEGNVFIGDGNPRSGGVRLTDKNHMVINNYFEGLQGTKLRSPLKIMGGYEDPGQPDLHWPMNSTTMDNHTVLYELTKGHNGVISNASYKSSCREQGCYKFKGANSYAVAPIYGNDIENVTVSFFMKASKENTTRSFILSRYGVLPDNKEAPLWSFEYAANNAIKVHLQGTEKATSLISDQTLKADHWYHIALSVTGGKKAVLYISGLKDSLIKTKARIKPVNGELYFGRQKESDKFNFKGLIDDVRIFDRELSKGEVYALAYYLNGYVPAENITIKSNIFVNNKGELLIGEKLPAKLGKKTPPQNIHLLNNAIYGSLPASDQTPKPLTKADVGPKNK